MSKVIKIIACVIVTVFATLGLLYSAMTIETTGKINRNVKIANADVAGLTKQKAYAKIMKLLDDKQTDIVVLQMGGFTKRVRLNGTIGATNLVTQIDKAYDYGKQGNFLENVLVWLRLKEGAANYPLMISYNEVQINSILENVKNDFIIGDKSDIIKRINILANKWPVTNLAEEVFNQEDSSLDNIIEQEHFKVIDFIATKKNIKKYLSNETWKSEIEIVTIGN